MLWIEQIRCCTPAGCYVCSKPRQSTRTPAGCYVPRLTKPSGTNHVLHARTLHPAGVRRITSTRIYKHSTPPGCIASPITSHTPVRSALSSPLLTYRLCLVAALAPLRCLGVLSASAVNPNCPESCCLIAPATTRVDTRRRSGLNFVFARVAKRTAAADAAIVQ